MYIDCCTFVVVECDYSIMLDASNLVWIVAVNQMLSII